MCCRQQVDSLRDKACGLQQQLGRQTEIAESSSCRARVLEEDKAILEARLHKAESDLTACDVAREALRRDKCTVGYAPSRSICSAF